MMYYNLRTVQRLLNHFLVHYSKDNQKEQQIIPIHCILKLTCHHKHMKTSKSYTQHLQFIPFLGPVFWLLKKKKYGKLGNLIKNIPFTVCVNQSGINQTHFNLSKEQQNFLNYCFSSYCSSSLTKYVEIIQLKAQLYMPERSLLLRSIVDRVNMRVRTNINLSRISRIHILIEFG